MKRLLSIAVLILPLSLFGASGDYIGASIDATGWQLWLEFASMGTNGFFKNFGFATNNSISGNETVKLSVTSQGFDSTGTAKLYTRTLYGTKQIRFAYPSNTFPDTTSNNISTTVKIALSDFVYSGDSNIVVTLASGVYTNLTVNSAVATAMPVTNNSTRPYPLPVCNWTWPGYQRETNATMRLRAVGFAQTADGGQPLACMKFVVSDGTTTTTNTVGAMAIDRTLPDIYPTGEYFTDVTLSPFIPYAAGGATGLLRCNFHAYPRLGTTSTVLITTDAAALSPSPCTITNLYDANYAYCNRIAVVDPAGNDTTGGRVTNVPPTSVNSAHYFATIRGAALQLTATNNLAAYGHNDPGGGIIYVRSGITNWTGGANITSSPVAWTIVTPYPGDTVSNLTTQLSGQLVGRTMQLYQMKIGGAGNLFYDPNGYNIWINQCTIDSTSGNLFRGPCLYSVTHSTVTNLTQGLCMVIGSMPTLLRGNLVNDGVSYYTPVYTIIGNHQTSNTLAYITIDGIGGQTGPYGNGAIIYNNSFNFRKVNDLINISTVTNITGCAIVQNVFECCTNMASQLMAFGTSSSGKTITNVMFWNNVFTGQRMDVCYNWSTVGSPNRTQVQLLNNIIDNYNCKTDSTAPNSADNTNNWEQIWAVGWNGNVIVNATNAAAGGGAFMNTTAGGFTGMNSIQNSPMLNIANYPQYINRLSFDPNIGWGNVGEGNYRTTSTAPQLLIQTRWSLPFDHEGNNRGLLDPPGAYSSATPKKGGGFF